MAAQLQEITATYLSERHRFANAEGDVVIATAWLNSGENREITIKVAADVDELKQEQTYLWSGNWTNQRYGEQFAATSFALKQPHGRQAVIYYLAAAGDGADANFGRARATKCWELYGEDAVRMLREQPEEVAAKLTTAGGIFRLTADQATRVAEVLRRDVAMESVNMEVSSLLAGRGFRRTLAKQFIRDYGAEAGTILRNNPFVLCGKYPGCGFKLCDAMWMGIGLPPAAIERQMYCAWHAVNTEREGSTWVFRGVAEQAIKSSIGSADTQPNIAIAKAIENDLLRECRTDGLLGPLSDDGNVSWLACSRNANDEELLARLVTDALEESHSWPPIDGIKEIDDEQPIELAKALKAAIAILCGRPGVGKTFVAAALIKLLIEVFGDGTVAVAAPTNLAAQKLNQALSEYRVPIKARTIHSLLGRPKIRGEDWFHNAKNPFPFKVIILDEQSMTDTRIMAAVFLARAKGTLILFLGDTNQLPPVDRGAPFRDFIASGVPCGNLKNIRRFSGGIAEACAAIAEGRNWKAGDNLEVIEVDDEESQQKAVIQKLTECQVAGLDPVWDARILVPKNATRRKFNKLLQGHLNPGNPAIAGVAFRVNDKIICRSKDDFKIVSVDSDSDEIEFGESSELVRVHNGEIGRVLEIRQGCMIVSVDHPRRVIRVPLGKIAEPTEDDDPKDDDGKLDGTGCGWNLAYATTVHSSQGQEFPWSIMVASSRDSNMLYREQPYTGFSRGKSRVVAVGLMQVWRQACKRAALPKRKTFLRERILIEQAKRQLELL